MESLPEESNSTSESLTSPQAPGRIQRVTDETRGLAEDLTAWVELKARHTQMEIEETVELKLNRAVVGVIIAIVGAVAALFLLVTLAIGAGWLLGHPFWGFLVVTAVLFVIAGVVRVLQPTLIRVRAERLGIDAPPPRQDTSSS